MYNLTYITDNANNLYEIAKGTNDLSNGLYFSLIFFTLFITYLVVFKKNDFKSTLLAGSFFMSIIGVIFYTLGFVSETFIITPILVLFISLFINIFYGGY
jgi:hypothetical protein